MKKSYLEERALELIKRAGFPDPVCEYKFHPERRWRFDMAWPDYKIAAEIEGAVWVSGRHTRGSGFTADCEKYTEAAIMGWIVLRYTKDTMNNIINDLKRNIGK